MWNTPLTIRSISGETKNTNAARIPNTMAPARNLVDNVLAPGAAKGRVIAAGTIVPLSASCAMKREHQFLVVIDFFKPLDEGHRPAPIVIEIALKKAVENAGSRAAHMAVAQ